MHDAGQSYVDIFIPLLLITLDSRHTESYSDLELKQLLYKDHNLDIPVHMVQNTLRRTSSLGYSRASSAKKHSITTLGMEILQKIQPLAFIKRTVNCFGEELHSFTANKIAVGKMPEKNELMDMFFNFIYVNSYALLLFTKGSLSDELTLHTEYEEIFKEFLIEIEFSKPKLYNIFEDILKGSILCSFAGKEDLQKTSQYHKKTVFLDSNIIFSILGFHHEDYCIPCQELHQQLRSFKFKLFVFDFTLTEIIGVLSAYRYEYPKYIGEVKVDSIYSNFKTQGLTPTDVDALIANIEEILAEKDIQIYPTAKKDREEMSNNLNNKIGDLQRYKSYQQSIKSLCHDLMAIEFVKRKRINRSRKFDETDYFFLTSDINLTCYTLEAEEHNENFTISEVILDSFMTPLLWIKNPTNDFNTNMLLPSLAQKDIINRHVWNKFVDTTISMINDGKIQKNDLSMLIYNKEFQENLVKMTNNGVAQITETTLEDFLDKTHSDWTNLENEIDDYKNKLIEIKKELIDRDEQLKKERENFFNSLKQKSEGRARKSTNNVVKVIKIIILGAIVLAGLTISYISKLKGIDFWLVWVAPTIGLFTVLGIPISIKHEKLIEKLEIPIYNHYLRKYRKEFTPEEYAFQIDSECSTSA